MIVLIVSIQSAIQILVKIVIGSNSIRFRLNVCTSSWTSTTWIVFVFVSVFGHVLIVRRKVGQAHVFKRIRSIFVMIKNTKLINFNRILFHLPHDRLLFQQYVSFATFKGIYIDTGATWSRNVHTTQAIDCFGGAHFLCTMKLGGHTVELSAYGPIGEFSDLLFGSFQQARHDGIRFEQISTHIRSTAIRISYVLNIHICSMSNQYVFIVRI